MKRICAWCNKALDVLDASDTPVTHGICEKCRILLIYQTQPLQQFIDKLDKPVLVLNKEGNVNTANKTACAMLGKTLQDIEGNAGGVVMECVYSRLPGGCGKTEHCSGCAIRNTVMKTFSSGTGQKEATAFQYIQMPDGVKRIKFLITTEKVNDAVFLRIDSSEEDKSC